MANRLKTAAYGFSALASQVDLSNNEKAARKRAAQVIGSALFDQFLIESLTAEDKARLEHFLNEKHKNHVALYQKKLSKVDLGYRSLEAKRDILDENSKVLFD